MNPRGAESSPPRTRGRLVHGLAAPDDAVHGGGGRPADDPFGHVPSDAGGIALERIAVAAPAGGLHDHEVSDLEREPADLSGQRRRLDRRLPAPDVEAVRSARDATAHAVGWQHALLGQHGQQGVGREDAHFADQPQAPAPAAGAARTDAGWIVVMSLSVNARTVLLPSPPSKAPVPAAGYS